MAASGGAPALGPGADVAFQADADEDMTRKAYAEYVGAWIATKSKEAADKGKGLAQWAQETFPTTSAFRQQFLDKVPWPPLAGYTFLAQHTAGQGKRTRAHCNAQLWREGIAR